MLRLCHLALFSGMLVNLCGCERGAPEGKDAPSSADTVSAADVPYPPEPDFENPVDYLAWFRERNFQEDWPAGIEVYAWAWSPEAGHEIPAPSDELKEQLVQAARAPWTTAEFPELPKYLTAVEPRLGLLQQAARVKDVQWLTDRSKEWCGMEWSLAKTTRWLMYGMMAKAWGPMTSEEERPECLLAAWRTALRHARHLEPGNCSLSCGYGMAIRGMLYGCVRSAVQRGVIDGASLGDLLELLLECGPPAAPVGTYYLEWMWFLDLMQQLYPGGQFSDVAAKRLGQDEWLPPRGRFLPRPQKTARRASKHYRRLVNAASKPYSVAALREIEAADDDLPKLAGHNLILSTYLFALSRTYLLALRAETERRATLLVVALYLHRDKQGRWPAGLDACDLPNLAEVRTDPFSGRDFVYELRDDQPWLYSVAHNEKDDGGRHDRRWGEKEPGRDFVFVPNIDLLLDPTPTSQPK